VICHRREILQQIAGAIEHHTGEAPELVEAGSKPNWGAPVLVAMVPTLARRLGQLLGRRLRPSPGKKRALLIDHGPSWQDLSKPDEEIGWSLDAATTTKPKGAPTMAALAMDGRIEEVTNQDPAAELRQITPYEATLQCAAHLSRSAVGRLCLE
jgi:superfamily II DNA or RNA helicase